MAGARDVRELWFSHHLALYTSGDYSDETVVVDYGPNSNHGTPINMDATNFTADVHTPT